MATRRIPDPKIGGSIPSEVILFFVVFGFVFLRDLSSTHHAEVTRAKMFPRRDLNPGLVGENHIS